MADSDNGLLWSRFQRCHTKALLSSKCSSITNMNNRSHKEKVVISRAEEFQTPWQKWPQQAKHGILTWQPSPTSFVFYVKSAFLHLIPCYTSAPYSPGIKEDWLSSRIKVLPKIHCFWTFHVASFNVFTQANLPFLLLKDSTSGRSKKQQIVIISHCTSNHWSNLISKHQNHQLRDSSSI